MKKVKILLVDDSAILLKHVTALLLKEGLEVIPKSDLLGALDAFGKYAPDAILADFILEGGHTGLEVLTAIFAASQQGKKPAAAILTLGALTAEDQARAASLGINIIQKPVRGKEDDFIQDINIWLKNKLG